MAIFLKILIGLCFIVAWPISKLLDLILGTHGPNRFERKELKELIHFHSEAQKGYLSMDETTVIKGALDLTEKTAVNCMTPLENLFMLEYNQILDAEILQMIKEKGHSRIPIYEGRRENLKGILLVKSLLFVNLENIPPVHNFELREFPSVPSDMAVYDLLNLFQTGRSHMAAVYDSITLRTIGIVTLEDVIEELIQEEILDEDDLAQFYRIKASELQKNADRFQKLSHSKEKLNWEGEGTPRTPRTPKTPRGRRFFSTSPSRRGLSLSSQGKLEVNKDEVPTVVVENAENPPSESTGLISNKDKSPNQNYGSSM